MKTENGHTETNLYQRECDSVDQLLREHQQYTGELESKSVRNGDGFEESDSSESVHAKNEREHDNLHMLFQSINPNQNSARCTL